MSENVSAVDISAAIAVLPAIIALDAKFHPMLKQAIAAGLFSGPLAKFQPIATEVDTVLTFLEQIETVVIPLLPKTSAT